MAVGAGLDAGLLALARLHLQAARRVDDDDLGDRLRERDVDGLGRLQPLVKSIRSLGRTLLDADLATDAGGPVDIRGFAADIHREVADVALDLVDLAVGQQLDVLVLGAVHHARREDTGRAVERGKRL